MMHRYYAAAIHHLSLQHLCHLHLQIKVTMQFWLLLANMFPHSYELF